MTDLEIIVPDHIGRYINPSGMLPLNIFANCYSCGSQENPHRDLGVIERTLRIDLFVLAHSTCPRPDWIDTVGD